MADPGEPRRWLRLRLALSVLPIGFGSAAIVWPEPTVRVAGLLFGANLVLVGLARAVLMTVTALFPRRHRAISVGFGLVTAAAGVICLRHPQASALLLVLAVGAGWLLDGVPATVSGAADEDAVRGWRLGIGVAAVLTALGVLLWPALSVGDAVVIVAVFFVVIGAVEAVAALAGLLRPQRIPS